MTDPYFGREFDAYKWLGPPVALLLVVMGGVAGWAITGGDTAGIAIGTVAALAFVGYMARSELQHRRRERGRHG